MFKFLLICFLLFFELVKKKFTYYFVLVIVINTIEKCKEALYKMKMGYSVLQSQNAGDIGETEH